jgi:hypothetical protein
LEKGAACAPLASSTPQNSAVRIFMWVSFRGMSAHYRHWFSIAPAPHASYAKMASCFSKER